MDIEEQEAEELVKFHTDRLVEFLAGSSPDRHRELIEHEFEMMIANVIG